MKAIRLVGLFIVGVFAFQNISVAQPDDEYNDLLFLLVDGKYDKMLYKSMDYIEDEETRRDPLPYFTHQCAILKCQN